MKKFIVLFTVLVFVSGCTKEKTAPQVVSNYLNEFQLLTKNISDEIESSLNNEKEYNAEHKKIYKEILTRQYKDLKYDIFKEEYDDDKALIYVNVNVYDLKKAEDDAVLYLSDHLSEFYNKNNVFDNDKYLSYKLNLMLNTSNRIDYEIIFYLEKKSSKWILLQPTDNDLEKIHGIYTSE